MRLVAAVLLAVTVGACATVPISAPPPPPTYTDKMAWILAMEDARVLRLADASADAADLQRLSADAEARVRRRAALAAGRVGLREGADLVRPLLQDPDPEVRQMAAFSLGLLGDRASLDALVAALDDDAPIVAASAVDALGRIGEPSAVPAIVRITQRAIAAGALEPVPTMGDDERRDTPAAVVRLALGALVRLKAVDAVAAVTLRADGTPVASWWPVAFALARAGDARALPALRTLAAAPDVTVRAYAVRGLAAQKDAAAVPQLLALAESAEAAVAVEAVRALGAIGDASTAGRLVRLLAAPGASPALRRDVVAALGSVLDAESGDALIDLLADRSPLLRAAAITSLARRDGAGFLAILSGLDTDQEWRVRAALATALGALPESAGLPRLRMMLRDPEPRVVAAVVEALRPLAPADGPSLVRDLLNHQDPVVRAAAARAVGAWRPEEGVAWLQQAWRRAQRDSMYTARAATLDALAAYGPTAVVAEAREALADPDWAVRVHAAAVLAAADPSVDAAQGIRPAPTRLGPDAYRRRTLTDPPVSTQAFIDTDRGVIQIELAVLDAPLAVDAFVERARQGFYDGLVFHRVVSDFVIQGGDPRGDGEGGPGYTLRDEVSQRPFMRGTVGIALDWADTGGSQFFITHAPQPHLDGRYPVIGRVLAGMDVVDRIEPLDVIRAVRIWDGVTPPGAGPQ